MALNEILGSRLVSQDELREGDKVFILHKRPVEVDQVKDADGEVYADADYYDPDKYDFYLAEREHEKIPSDAGHVIELTGTDGTKHRWLSWHDFSQGKILWVKAANGTRQGHAQMQARADAAKSWVVIL